MSRGSPHEEAMECYLFGGIFQKSQKKNTFLFVMSTNDSGVDNVMFSREGLTEAERERK